MHLHGHTFQVTGYTGHEIVNGARRDTVTTPRANCRNVSICFDANNFGEHFFHCHFSYHMVAGMLTSIKYLTSQAELDAIRVIEAKEDANGANQIAPSTSLTIGLIIIAAVAAQLGQRRLVLEEQL
jgi:hypothetical protein